MYVLGIDTATKVAGTAIVRDSQIVSERFIHNKLTHSQILLPMVDQVIKDAGISVRELNGIAIAGGPGSFTGLRIGMAMAKTFGQILDIPVAAISTLKVLALNAIHFDGLICPIMDARKNEVYTATYRYTRGEMLPVLQPEAIGITKLAAKLASLEGKIMFLGDGVPVYFEQLHLLLGDRAIKASPLALYSRASAAALLGEGKLIQGQTGDLLDLAPVYLRRSEAEITWEQKRGESVNEETGNYDLCKS